MNNTRLTMLIVNILISMIAITIVNVTDANGLGAYLIGFFTFAVMDIVNRKIDSDD